MTAQCLEERLETTDGQAARKPTVDIDPTDAGCPLDAPQRRVAATPASSHPAG